MDFLLLVHFFGSVSIRFSQSVGRLEHIFQSNQLFVVQNIEKSKNPNHSNDYEIKDFLSSREDNLAK